MTHTRRHSVHIAGVVIPDILPGRHSRHIAEVVIPDLIRNLLTRELLNLVQDDIFFRMTHPGVIPERCMRQSRRLLFFLELILH